MGSGSIDDWSSAEAYERYVGRWSRKVAHAFLDWLQPASALAWADVGAGTGALTSIICERCAPSRVQGVDASAAFVAQARQRLPDPRVQFEIGSATALPWPAGSFGLAVSGLVLNFVPDHAAMAREMARVTRPGGTVALYVWDYAQGMQMMRLFWDAAAIEDPAGTVHDESTRFPICQPAALQALFEAADLAQVETSAIEVPTEFADFDDYWMPFLGRTGAAPAYLATLSPELQARIRDRLHGSVPRGDDGRIALTARAYAVKGVVR